MSKAPCMPVFTDALLGDTLHLTAEEFGAYCLLLFATWRNNGEALADDDAELARVCRVSVRKWREKLRKKLVRFFNTNDGFWHQKRLEKEWAYVAEKAEISRRNGARGGRPRKNPAGSSWDTQNETTHTHTQKESGSSTESLEPREESAKTAQAPFFAEPPPVGYAFEGRVIRLTQKDLNLWRRAYHRIADITATLQSLDDYYASLPAEERKRWFIRCSRALGNIHQGLMAGNTGGRYGQGISPATNLFRGFYEAAIEGGETGDCGADWPPPVALLDSQRPAGSAQGSSTGLA